MNLCDVKTSFGRNVSKSPHCEMANRGLWCLAKKFSKGVREDQKSHSSFVVISKLLGPQFLVNLKQERKPKNLVIQGGEVDQQKSPSNIISEVVYVVSL